MHCKVSSSSSKLFQFVAWPLTPWVHSVPFILACSFTNWDVMCVCPCRVDGMTAAAGILFSPELLSFSVKNSCRFNCYPWMCRCEWVNWVSELSTPIAPHIVGIVSFCPLHCYFIHAQSTGELEMLLLVLAAPEVIAGKSKPLYLLKLCFFWHTAISQNQFQTFLNMFVG